MTYLAGRTKFGRYIYAIGGNPEAAELAGVNNPQDHDDDVQPDGRSRRHRACITSARLDAASNSLGQSTNCMSSPPPLSRHLARRRRRHDLWRDARRAGDAVAAVGMTLLNFDSAVKDVVVGSVLVIAVWIDQLYRRRRT